MCTHAWDHDEVFLMGRDLIWMRGGMVQVYFFFLIQWDG